MSLGKLFVLATGSSLALLTLATSGSASAMIPGRIIDDSIFSNSATMNAAQIDGFLNSFPNSCISPNSGFSAIVPYGFSPNAGYSFGGYDTAGNVIATAAQVYGINPQVLLATLQKEQSLVVGGANYCNNGEDHKYAAAAGYGCPDSGTRYNYTGVNLYRRNGVVHSTVGPTCVNNSAKAGFSQQVIRAAWLLKFGQQRSLGNVGWSVVRGNWDNSDDPESCYSGPMTEGYRQICPSGQSIYYSGVKNIDGQAVHMDSGATASLYWYTPHFHGNEMFSSYFTQWFGNPLLPYAFKAIDNPTIYVYVNGYKVVATAMGVLQDYGISPQSIQTITQAAINAIPSPAPADNISTNLSYIVKSSSDSDTDGGSIYLISIGRKYQITSMQQFSGFGFSESNIGYMPLSYLNTIPSGPSLKNYISAPNSSVFQVSGGSKRLIMDYATYLSLNPSDNATPVSYFIADLIGSGMPLSNTEALIRYNGSAGVYILAANKYFLVPTSDAFSCWGFESKLAMPVRTLADNSYISPITSSGSVGCLVNDGSNSYLLSRDRKYVPPAGYGVSTAQTDAALVTLAAKLPTSSDQLKQYVKGSASAGIWYLESGKRRVVPTYSNFSLLNPSMTVVDNGALSSIASQGVKLATGQAVKADNSPTVYVISNDSRIAFATSDSFVSYYKNWDAIETYPAAVLDQYYPYANASVQRYFHDAAAGNTYLVSAGDCYGMSPTALTAYGQSQSTIAASHSYTKAAFPNLNLAACKPGSFYAKQPGQALVYWVDGGQKHPVLSWSKLQQHSQQAEPYVIAVTPSILESLTTGAPL